MEKNYRRNREYLYEVNLWKKKMWSKSEEENGKKTD